MTIQTQMKIDPQVGNIEVPTRNTEPHLWHCLIPDHSQKPLRILQKSAEEKAKEQEALT